MLHLCEIGSRHNSYINMIHRQVAFYILTAHFLGRQMSDVSMGVSGRGWLSVVFFFFPFFLPDAMTTGEGFLQRIEMERENMLSDGERFSH